MKIKIGKFNFISEQEDNMDLHPVIDDRFNYFYMDGKEDTLYVHSRYDFDNAYEHNKKYEKELLKNYYVIEYTSLIRNSINRFIREKAMRLLLNDNYSRYNLYNEFDIKNIETLEEDAEYKCNYYTKINSSNKMVCDFNDGSKLIFDPYTEKLDNLEEMYKKGYFDRAINANLILLEIQKNIAPQFIMEMSKINDFLKDKKSITILFKDGNKIKVDKSRDFLSSIHNEIRLDIDDKYKIQDIDSLLFNRSELPITCENLMNLKNQIQKTAEDCLLFKIDDMKKNLREDFNNYQHSLDYKISMNMPSYLESCINEIEWIESRNLKIEQGEIKEEKKEYPEWYSKEFTNLWKQYEQIKELETANTIEDIKEIVQETGDNELQKIYYMLKGEEEEESEEIMS